MAWCCAIDCGTNYSLVKGEKGHMKLTSKNVDMVMTDCLAEDLPEDQRQIVEGIINNYAFDPAKIEKNKENIQSMLAELPDQFKQTGGGGWSFLNLCMTKDDVQWTGQHWQQEKLVCLGIAAGLASWLMKEFANVMPGGMPYVQIKDGEN